jgi:hypothetical protein
VETELNGLMTYDRAMTKPNAAQVRRANQRLIDESAYVGDPGACASQGAAANRNREPAAGTRAHVPARRMWDPASR